MRNGFQKLILMLGVLTLVQWAQADNSINTRLRNQYLNPRAMGMGNAFSAVADDYTTLFYNPAGLARLNDWQLNMSMMFSLGTDLFKFTDDIKKASENEATKNQEIADIIKKLYGSHHYFRTTPLEGVWVWPHWGVGVVPADIGIDLAFHEQVGPVVDADIISDTTIAVGYGRDYPWFENARFSMGYTGKVIYRGQLKQSFSVIDLADNSDLFRKDMVTEGATVDADIGTLFTPELPSDGLISYFKYAKPTFALVARNVLDSGFSSNGHLISKDSASGSPDKLGRRFDIGTRWEYPGFWVFKPRGVMDFRDLGTEDMTLLKALHIGWELQWKMYNWWKGAYRIGLNQGYWTAGFSARLAWFNLDLNSWGEEVGSTTTRQENRIYMVKLNIEI